MAMDWVMDVTGVTDVTGVMDIWAPGSLGVSAMSGR